MCLRLLLPTYCATLSLQDPDSWEGQKLMRRGAAHTGSWVTCLSRMRLATPDGANRQALLGGTAQGGLLLLSPFWDDAMFRRMTSLYVRGGCGAQRPHLFRDLECVCRGGG